MTKALPLLNKLIPAGLAVKGLSKMDGRLKQFFSSALSAGYTADHVLDYLRQRMQPAGQESEENLLQKRESQGQLSSQEKVALGKRQSEKKLGSTFAGGIGLATGLGSISGMGEEEVPPSTGGSPIPTAPEMALSQSKLSQPPPAPEREQQVSPLDQLMAQYPPLFEFIQSEMGKGRPLDQVLALAINDRSLSPMIRDIEKKTKTRFFDFIQSLMGKSKSKQQGQGNQALLSAIDKIMKM